MPAPWTINPATFNGTAFATRYSLNSRTPDFWINGTQLFLRSGVTIPDDPPILDPLDPPELRNRTIAIAAVDSTGAEAKLIRGAAAVLVDEINLVREWIVSFKAAVAAATNLANLQSRVAALPDMPDRTLAQAKTAIKAKITAGTVD